MGENELRIGKGFVGSSGVELLRMLDESSCITLTSEDHSYISRYWSSGDPRQLDMVWNLHPECYRSNVFQLHPPSNRIEAFCGPRAEALAGYPALVKGKFVRREFAPQLERLADELLHVNPNLVVCLGNSALWAMCGSVGISKLRGTTSNSSHTVGDFKCLGTYHPAAVLRQWELRPVTVADLMKASREAEYPEIRRPKREIWIEPTIEDIQRFINEYIVGSPLTATDIETSGTRITCIGFAPRTDIAIVIPFDDSRRKDRSYWPTKQLESQAWGLIRRVLEDPTILKSFQNGLYDIAFTWRSYGIKVRGAAEDSMLAHHALQPESLKGLAFLGSVYANETAWKTERRVPTTTIGRDK